VIGMPMGGRGNVTASLDLPNNDWRRARAKLSVDCPGCTVGGEGAYFKPKAKGTATAAYVDKGVPVPLISILSLKAEWQIENERIKTNRFEFVSPHLAVELDFTATIEKDLKSARVEAACLRYRGTEELKTLDLRFYNALELTGGPLVASDNLRHLKLVGTLANFKAIGKECGDPTGGDAAPDDRVRVRPDLGSVPTSDGAGTGDVAPAIDPPPPAPPDALPTPQVDDVGSRVPPPPTPDVDDGKPAGSVPEPPPAEPSVDRLGGSADPQEPPPAEGEVIGPPATESVPIENE
jgi:hypothetical protein